MSNTFPKGKPAAASPLCRALMAILATAVMPSAYAESVNVSDSARVDLQATTNVIVSTTVTQGAAYPASVGDPVFWLDCADTNGWEFTGSGATLSAVKIPSKVGSRSLAQSWPDGNWNRWTSNNVDPIPPCSRRVPPS